MTSDTIALAGLGATLIVAIANIALALSTRAMAKSTSKSVDLQQREFDPRAVAARPLLETTVSRVNATDFSVAIKWVRGTEPAFDPELWVKQTA